MENSKREQNFDDNRLVENFQRDIIPDIYSNLRSKNYNNALEVLEDFYQQNTSQVHNSSLMDKCNSWKAHIFEKQERYQEALLLHREICQSRETNDIFYINSQIDMARVLYKMGECAKAIEIIREILRQEIEDSADLLSVLNLYVDILESSNQLFPPEYKVFVENLAEQLGIELSNVDLNNSNNLTQEVKELSQKDRDANKRYSILVIGLNQIEDKNRKKSVLESYISEETVSLYRNMAVEALNNYEN